jgi:tetratricopeptide (TPR) repeat protein
MKNYLLPTALFGSVALVSYVLPAVALSPVEVQRIAKQTTVQIAGCNRSSGVIIQKNGNTYKVLTVAYGIRKSGCEIVAPDDSKYQVTQVNTFPDRIDLAVVSFTSTKNYPVAKLIDNSDRAEAGETIYVSGFPVSSAIAKSVFTFVKGDLVSNSTKQQDRGYSLIYSSDRTLLGQSGSTVWNDRGEVIAIQGQGEIDTKLTATMNPDVLVKTGFNLGITVNTFTKLAPAAGVGGFAPIVFAVRQKPVDDLIASAVQNERKGDYREMLADLDRAIFLDSQNARLYYTRGVAKSMLGNRDAIEDFNQAIALNLNEALIYHNRGVAKSEFGDLQGAISDYTRAISLQERSANALDPNRAETYYHRGNAQVALGNRQGGIADFNRAIAIDPNLAPAYYRRGLVKSKLGDNKGEIEDLNRAITLNPNYTAAHYHLGLAKSALGDNKGAIESFNRAIALNSKDPETYYERGNARSKVGDNKGAIEDYDRTIAIAPNRAQAYANRGSIKAKLGDKKGAIVDLKKAANRFKLQRQTASYKRVISEIQRIGS